MPERADLDGGEVRRAGVLDDAAPALNLAEGVGGGGAVAAGGEAELPVCVALEVVACGE